MKMKECKIKTRQIPGPCKKAEKIAENEGDCDTNHNLGPWNGPQEPGKKIGGTEDWRKN